MSNTPFGDFRHIPRGKAFPICVSLLALSLFLLVALACRRSSSYQSGPISSGPATTASPSETSAPISNGRTLPNGFRSMAPASGRGEVIIGGMTGNQASPALWAALTALGTYYDAKPNVLGAFVTSGDDEIQALFEA